MDLQSLTDAEHLIMNNDFAGFKRFYIDYRTKYNHITKDKYDHTFRLLFLTACMFGKTTTAKWLYKEFYVEYNDQKKREFRPTLNRCLVLSKRHEKFHRLSEWLHREILKENEKDRID